MKKLLILLLACLSCAAAQARSLVIQESARLTTPDPSYPDFGTGVAIDGDDAMVLLRRYTPPSDEFGVGELEELAVWLFRRVNGTWTPVRQVETSSHGLEYICGMATSTCRMASRHWRSIPCRSTSAATATGYKWWIT